MLHCLWYIVLILTEELNGQLGQKPFKTQQVQFLIVRQSMAESSLKIFFFFYGTHTERCVFRKLRLTEVFLTFHDFG